MTYPKLKEIIQQITRVFRIIIHSKGDHVTTIHSFDRTSYTSIIG